MRALVVDDSKPSRSIVARTLRELRFDCIEAANGAEALAALAASARPDIVTVNWHMPVMDGLELVRRLRRDPAHRDLRLLMISTEHDRARVAEALAAGVDDYLAKPFTAASLTRKLIDLGVCSESDVAAGRRPIRTDVPGPEKAIDAKSLPVNTYPPEWGVAKHKEFMDRYLRLARR